MRRLAAVLAALALVTVLIPTALAQSPAAPLEETGADAGATGPVDANASTRCTWGAAGGPVCEIPDAAAEPGEPDDAGAAARWYADDADGDGFMVAGSGDVDGDGDPDLVVAATATEDLDDDGRRDVIVAATSSGGSDGADARTDAFMTLAGVAGAAVCGGDAGIDEKERGITINTACQESAATDDAAERCQANGRKTVRAGDLGVQAPGPQPATEGDPLTTIHCGAAAGGGQALVDCTLDDDGWDAESCYAQGTGPGVEVGGDLLP